MRIYIANLTRQHQLFMYFVIGEGKRRQIPIAPTQQVVLPDTFVSQDEVDYVINQHAAYGLVNAANGASSSRKPGGFYGLCYSVDKPVTAAMMGKLFTGNRELLDAQGRELRKMAAIAANDELVRSLSRPGGDPDMPRPDLGDVQVTVQEEVAEGTSSEMIVAEGYKIPGGAQPQQARAGSSGRGRRNA